MKITSDKLLFWAFCLFFLSIPIGTSPAVISGAIALAIWVFSGKFYKDRDKWLYQSWSMPTILFMILPFVGLIWSNDIHEGWKFAQRNYYYLYAFAIASLSLSRENIKTFMHCFLGGMVILCICSLIHFFTGDITAPTNLPTIFYARSSTASLWLVFSLLVLSFLYANAKTKAYRWVYLCLFSFFLFMLGIGTGRIGHVAFVLTCPIMMIYFLGKQRAVLAVVVAVVIAVGFVFTPMVQYRFEKIKNDLVLYEQGLPYSDAGIRLSMWQSALKVFVDNPLIGAGTGGYKQAGARYQHPNLTEATPSDPHNSYLYLAANFGILGLGLFGWFMYEYVKTAWSLRSHIEGAVVLFCALIIGIGSFTNTQILTLGTAKLFAVFAGIKHTKESHPQ